MDTIEIVTILVLNIARILASCVHSPLSLFGVYKPLVGSKSIIHV